MIMEFTCKTCGAKFTREWNGRPPMPRRCETCKRETARELNRKWKAAQTTKRKKARANNTVMKKCHRCGRMFEERPLPSTTISAADSPYFSHRYCPSCTWSMKRAARTCDPRYVGVGGHSDILETGR